MSAARAYSVLPRVRTSTSAAVTAALKLSISFCIAFAACPVGAVVGADHRPVDTPGCLDLQMPVVGEQRPDNSAIYRLKPCISCQDQFTTSRQAPSNVSWEDVHPITVQGQAAGCEVA